MDLDEKSMRKPNALLEMHAEDLSDASIHELEERISILQAEVVRVETVIAAKKESHKSADAFFKK